MGNPFMAAMGGSHGPQGGPMNFVQFMMQHKGENPNQLLNKMLSSGQFNQSQVNQAQQAAKQLENRFDGFKSMFGF